MDKYTEQSQARGELFRELLIDYHLLGYEDQLVMLRFDAPKVLVEAIKAGLIANVHGNENTAEVRQILADHIALPIKRNIKDEAFCEVFHASINYVEEVMSRFVRDDSRTPRLGVKLSDRVLRRLRGSMIRAGFLYRTGGWFEGDAIVRQILEQLAWAYCVCEIADVKSIGKISPTKSITPLASLISSVGRFYGRLSTLAHLSPKIHGLFMTEHDGKQKIIEAHGEESLLQVFNLTVIADIFAVVFEYTQEGWMKELKNWVRNDSGKLKLIQDRQGIPVSEQTMSIFNEIKSSAEANVKKRGTL